MDKTTSDLKDEAAKPAREKMIPLNAYFTHAESKALKELSEAYGISLSSIIRHGTCGNVAKILGEIWYVDRQQAAEIDSHIVTLANIMKDIRVELHRIGVNYNQEIRLRQIEKKRAELAEQRRKTLSSGSLDWNVDDDDISLEDAVKRIKSKSEPLSVEKLNELLTRYEVATQKASEALCRIHG